MGTKSNEQNRSSRRHFLALSAGLSMAAGFGLGKATTPAHAAAGTYDVRTFGATGNGTSDDAAAIQSALDAAVGGGVVTIPSGTYRVTAALRVGSGTTLQMTSQTIILRDFSVGDTFGATICNANQTGQGNTSIAIIGGVLQARNSSAVGKHLGFRAVNGLLVQGTRFAGVYHDWNTALMGVSNATLSGLVMDSGRNLYEDGIHIGGGRAITISDCVITCGDDAISLTQEYADLPDIEDITIQNCVVNPTLANGVRILTTTNKEVRRVVLRGITGAIKGSHGIAIEDQSQTGRVHDITVDGASFDLGTNPATAVNVLGARGVRLENISLNKTKGRPFYVEKCTDIYFNRCEGAPSTAGLQSLLALNSQNVNLDQFISRNATQHGIVFSGVRNGSIHSAGVYNAADSGIQLTNTTGVRVSDCQCTGNVWGIRVDGGSATNLLMNNDFTGNSGGAVFGTPSASDTWSNNAGIDVPSRGLMPPGQCIGGYGSSVEPNPIMTPSDIAGPRTTGAAAPATKFVPPSTPTPATKPTSTPTATPTTGPKRSN